MAAVTGKGLEGPAEGVGKPELGTLSGREEAGRAMGVLANRDGQATFWGW